MVVFSLNTDCQRLTEGKYPSKRVQDKGTPQRPVIVPGYMAGSLHHLLLELYVASCPERNRTGGHTCPTHNSNGLKEATVNSSEESISWQKKPCSPEQGRQGRDSDFSGGHGMPSSVLCSLLFAWLLRVLAKPTADIQQHPGPCLCPTSISPLRPVSPWPLTSLQTRRWPAWHRQGCVEHGGRRWQLTKPFSLSLSPP